MQSSFLTEFVLPLCLGIIMLGMGMSLNSRDFGRVLVMPKAVFLGLFNQLVMVPVIAVMTVQACALKPELAVGLMVLAACPGGAVSNLVSYLCRADAALSVTLTAISSFVTVFTVPFIVGFALDRYMGSDSTISLPVFRTIVRIFSYTVLPVSVGMVIRYRWPRSAARLEPAIRKFSMVFLLVIAIGAIIRERGILVGAIQTVGLATFVLNVSTMIFGFVSGKVAGLGRHQCLTLAIESGIQNAALGMVITATLLGSPEMALAPAIYSLVMLFTGGALVFGTQKLSPAVA